MTEQEAINKLKKPPYEVWKHGIADLEWDNALEVAISALQEIQQYREIATVEECQKAREKPIPKKPIAHRDEYDFYYTCPTCNSINIIGIFCHDCCQKIDWSEDLNGKN